MQETKVALQEKYLLQIAAFKTIINYIVLYHYSKEALLNEWSSQTRIFVSFSGHKNQKILQTKRDLI